MGSVLVGLAAVSTACGGTAAGSPPNSTVRLSPTDTTGSRSSVPSTSSDPTTTTSTTLPATTTTTTTVPPDGFSIGSTWLKLDDTARGRSLPTLVLYPRAGSAAGPDRGAGPYPLVVFAHGFDTVPLTYAPLLEAWVKAGFVVAAPIFPGENEYHVDALGGLGSVAGDAAEADIVNEPGDIAFVVNQIEALSSQAGGLLSGLIEHADLALAGQSDGANAIAALVYDHRYAATYASMEVKPKAVALLSGSADPFETSADSWGSPAGALPAVLAVQSNADTCNTPAAAVSLYNELPGTEKWFVTLESADHLGPYVGEAPWAPLVEEVTSVYFGLELGSKGPPVTPGALVASGTANGVASTAALDVHPPVPATPGGKCSPPPPPPPEP